MSRSYVIGIDIGGSFTRIGLVDDNYQLHQVRKIATSDIVSDFSNVILGYVQDWQKEYHILAISMGFPGLVNAKTLEVISVPNQRLLEGSDYLVDLQRALKLPLFIDKDTSFLFIHDIDRLQLNYVPSVLAFYIGTGFGNAIRINGITIVGDHGAAGEIGHLPLHRGDLKCGCGQTGCTETMASGWRLRQIQEKFFVDTRIDDVFEKHTDHPEIQLFIKSIAQAIAIEMNLLDISTIIIGGGVPNMRSFPKIALEDLIKKSLRNANAIESLSIHYANSDAENGILGAGIHAFQSLEKK